MHRNYALFEETVNGWFYSSRILQWNLCNGFPKIKPRYDTDVNFICCLAYCSLP